MFWPFFSSGWPSMSQPSPPSGNATRRGARSCHFSGTYFVHTGGVSTCPSAEITRYLRPMFPLSFLLAPSGHACGVRTAPKRSGGGVGTAGELRRLDPQVALEVTVGVDDPD